MSTPKNKVRTEEELIHDLKVKDQTERKEEFIKRVDELQNEFDIKISVEMMYRKNGIAPQLILIDTKGQEDVKEETTA